MLLDTRAGLEDLHRQLQLFLASAEGEVELPAEQDGSPAPYDAFLPGLQVRKTVGPILLSQLPSGWLRLEGSPENLRRYVSHFSFPVGQESGHRHPENNDAPGYLSKRSLSLVIEADSTWSPSGAA